MSSGNRFQIAICQDGKFAVTFDTESLQIKVLESPDYRPFKFNKSDESEDEINNTNDTSRNQNESADEIINTSDTSRNHNESADEIINTNDTSQNQNKCNELEEIKITNTDDSSQNLNEHRINMNKITNTDAPSLNKPKINNNIIAHFKIKADFTIDMFNNERISNSSGDSGNNGNKDKYRWSLDISNLRQQKHLDGKYFILIAVSRVNVDEDMKKNDTNSPDRNYMRGYLDKKKIKTNNGKYVACDVYAPKKRIIEDIKGSFMSKNETLRPDKGIAIYCLKLQQKEGILVVKNMEFSYSYRVSGICKFVDVIDDKSKSEDKKSENNNVEQKRFVILNFGGIYNFQLNDSKFDPFAPKGISFNLNKKFEYPKSIRRELNNWYIKDDCMRRLRSYIYDKYFLVTQYKNDVQSLEVYNLAKMELETSAKKVESQDKFVRRYNYDNFSVSRLQLCFTRGINRVRLYYLENGLQVTSKKLDDIEKIHLLEFFDSDEKILIIGSDSKKELKFIIWDLYNTDKTIRITLDECYMEGLDQTLGNILHVDDKGNVTSVLKKIENELKELEKKESKPDRKAKCIECNNDEHNNDGPNSRKDNNIYYYNEDTIPNFDKVKEDIISYFKKVADEIEPWVLDDGYEKNSYCLYYNKEGTKTEFLQLIVGRSTVQIWHQIRDDDDKKKDKLPNKGDPFLEYIWMNGISVDQENEKTKLQIEDFKYESNDANDENVGSNVGKDWYLKVRWNIDVKKSDKTMERTMVIRRKDIIETFKPVIHACKALKHLNKHYNHKSLVDHYNKVHKYEEIATYVKHIVWRFAEHNPEQFKLLDFRYNFMKNLILGDCDQLIKYILFGDEESIDNKNVSSKEKEKHEREKRLKSRHIPKIKLWPGKKFIEEEDLDFSTKDDKPENNMELAIYHCKGRELKDTTIIAYFLEYYSGHATDCAGWMSTVSKALPLLFKYNYDDYAGKLFHKECFANQDHFLAQDHDEIIPKRYLERRNHNIKFRAFRPIVKLNSGQQEWRDIIFKPFKDLKNMIYKLIEDFDNDLEKSPLALRVVPLPGVIMNDIPKRKAEYSFKRIVLDLFCFIFIPRWYQIGRHDKDKLSPFSRMVLYENNDDIYDNPATEAIIDFRWQEARNFFWLLFIRFFIFAICFGAVSWEYLNRNADISGKFLVALFVIFYYLTIYQLATEILQLKYRGPRRYFNEIFNIIDLISILLSVTVISIMIKNFQLSDGFGSVETVDTGLMVGISFSIFFLWIELIFYLRLLSSLGIYIYYFVTIVKTVFPFFLFMLIVIFAFGHTMFFLLLNPNNIDTKDTTFSGNATNTLTNETLNIKLKSDFDPNSRIDNPFSSLSSAIIAAYFWINGNWIQRDEFDFWAVDVFSLIFSVVLSIFLQNMLIAYMSDEFTSAATKSRQVLLRRRANHIADYEALYHIRLWQYEPEPKYIYYFGQSKNFEKWYEIKKNDQDAIYKVFEEKSTFTRHTFKERDYDNDSILVYNNDTSDKMEIKNMKNNIIKYLGEKFEEQSNDEMEKIKNLKYFIEKLFDSK